MLCVIFFERKLRKWRKFTQKNYLHFFKSNLREFAFKKLLNNLSDSPQFRMEQYSNRLSIIVEHSSR
jgi:hypothetical protein